MGFTAAGLVFLESWQKLFCFPVSDKGRSGVPIMQSSGAAKKTPALESLGAAFYIARKQKNL